MRATRLGLIVAGTYAALGLLWIGFSSGVVDPIIADSEAILRWELFKGIGFVLVSAVVLFGLVTVLVGQVARAEETQRQIIDGVRDHAIFRLDSDGRVATWNRGAERIKGWSATEIIGQHFETFYTEEDRAVGLPARLLATARRDGVARSVGWRVRRDGTRFLADVTISLLRGADGDGGFVKVTRDVTEQEAQRVALERSERQFRAFLTHLPGIGFLKDAAGRYRIVSSGWESFWGIPGADGIGRTDTELFGEDQAAGFTRNDAIVRDTGSPVTTVELARGFAFLSTKFPVAIDEEVWVGGVAIDITERLRTEDALRESQTALRRLLARLSSVREEEETGLARQLHDELGSALTAARMDVAWVVRHLEGDPELAERLGALGRLLDDMIVTVRRISRDLRPQILDDLGLLAALDWLARDMGGRAGLDVTVEGTEPPGLAPAHRDALYRIGQEALTNVVRHAGARSVQVRLAADAKQVVLEVTDDGRGVSERSLTGGSLGVLGMRERAAQIGGTLVIRRRAEGGTHVRVEVPIT